MSLTLRRLLNHLPILHGSTSALYVKSTWHKPSIYDQCRSQAPFQPMHCSYRSGRGLRFRRLLRGFARWIITLAIAWVVIESARAMAIL